ncbi:putative metallo-beta-lactamase superfamily protein [Neofusicoccum parvum UCRNP2]|uniref:Putative metallo-beta-lactamase superfamily protein n=1 Tax=Botryosphaeria parva (strain UCR-NP2) TaxID=1287680 RepID=R1GBE1_BOTPV|nr:putative metallo-beta-lactamase superfamily protein [Neofusicoccum parvum UCRNP2]
MIPLGPYFDGATTTLVCGPGTLAMTGARGTHPTTPSSLYDGRVWDPAAADVPVREVDDLIAARGGEARWQPLAAFDRAYDFFGDGSFWLLDAPGHLPGNLAALARVRARADGAGEGGDADYRHIHTHTVE